MGRLYALPLVSSINIMLTVFIFLSLLKSHTNHIASSGILSCRWLRASPFMTLSISGLIVHGNIGTKDVVIKCRRAVDANRLIRLCRLRRAVSITISASHAKRCLYRLVKNVSASKPGRYRYKYQACRAGLTAACKCSRAPPRYQCLI